MQTVLSLLLVLLSSAIVAQADDSAIYNDDPMQKLPLGTEHSEYTIRQPTGAEGVTERIDPPNWWTGMQEPRVELMIHAEDIGTYSQGSASVDYSGVSVDYLRRLENPNYLFVGLRIAPGTSPGNFTITLNEGTGDRAQQEAPLSRSFDYELRPHPRDSQGRSRLSQADLMYLIMPDRFASGDASNDSVDGMAQTGNNREKVFFRHGGDIQGIIDRLDYLADLGVTALWLNPVLENDQPYESYHGYAVTDHYAIDRRFGSNEDYRRLVEEAHARGIKIVMDVIHNHVGDRHYFIQDLPSSDWIHQWPEYTPSNFRATILLDPHATEADREQLLNGWFDKHMPDLNQDNDQLANYLIQNAIWWTMYSGQDGFRIDTYFYPDPNFAARWNRRLRAEFPNLAIFGETWVNYPSVQAAFVEGDAIDDAIHTDLPGVTDFQLYFAIHEALGREPGWTEGVVRLYGTLAQDFLYEQPESNVIFLDNHDISRLYSSLGKDNTKMRSALALLLTLRGIPMLYYGTELGFEGEGGAFGEAGRIDFPGGFPGDERNLFSPTDRSENERALFDYTRSLARYRQESDALRYGNFVHYVPRDGVYVYFRTHGAQRVMVIFNGNGEPRTDIDLSHYDAQFGGFTEGTEVSDEMRAVRLTELQLAPKEVKVIELHQ